MTETDFNALDPENFRMATDLDYKTRKIRHTHTLIFVGVACLLIGGFTVYLYYED